MCLYKNLLEYLSLKKCKFLRDIIKSDKITSSKKELVISNNLLKYLIEKYDINILNLENNLKILNDSVKVNFYYFSKYFKNEKELEEFLDLKIKKVNKNIIYLY